MAEVRLFMGGASLKISLTTESKLYGLGLVLYGINVGPGLHLK
jgi:hypothetical protein